MPRAVTITVIYKKVRIGPDYSLLLLNINRRLRGGAMRQTCNTGPLTDPYSTMGIR